jgi:hypothetical protein
VYVVESDVDVRQRWPAVAAVVMASVSNNASAVFISVVLAAAGVFELRGEGIEGFHQGFDVLHLGDGYMDVEFGRDGVELDG